ncbi:MAG TPA: hypothetical protein VFB78_17650 [Acidimicrobiales bacterium]|nr:hypothetical protein [Acidimicrobiales bacterium]
MSTPDPALTTPTWDRAKAALAAGDANEAQRLLDRAVEQWRSLQDYSINWITALLSFIGREQGEAAVERALREFGDEFVSRRRDPAWDTLPAATRARAIARAMLANFGTCDVSEDDEKITLSFQCGTGGRLIDEGRYDDQGGPHLTLREAGPRTFMRDGLPVYCAHCSINNEIQPVEDGRAPVTVEIPPTAPGEPCVHHIYKDTAAIPTDVYERIGLRSRP